MSRELCRRMWLGLWLGIAMFQLAAAEPAKEAKAPADPFAKWEKDIARMEANFAKDRPAPGGALFYGSSSIRLWKLDASFPDLKGVNHGFGGSQLADALHFFERVVTPLKPRVVVLYEGDNDLASGKSPEQVAADFEAFVAKMHSALPDSRLVVIPVKPSPSRWKLIDKQRAVNAKITELAKPHAWISVVQIEAPMLNSQGEPRAELFQKDMLHLNDEGYALWTKLVAPLLK